MFKLHSSKILFTFAMTIVLFMLPLQGMKAEELVDETDLVDLEETVEFDEEEDVSDEVVTEEQTELEEIVTDLNDKQEGNLEQSDPEQQVDDEKSNEEKKEKSSPTVQFKDAKLEALIAKELNTKAPLTEEDLLTLDTLSLYGDKSETKIKSLEGIQYAKNLTQIGLENQEIQDLSPLSDLTGLIAIVFNGNKIDDLSPLANLKKVGLLYLEDNNISNLTPLIEMNSNNGLWQILLTNNNITDISPLQQISWADKNKRIRMLGNSVDDDRTIQHLISDGIYVLSYEKNGISYEYISERGLCELNRETFECKDSYSRIDMLHLVNTFPAAQGFVVNHAGEVSVFDHSEVKLSANQLSHLIENNLPLSIVNEKVQLDIPSSVFNNQDEEVTITLKELDRVDKSKSSVYDFSIQQGHSNISQFDEGVTLTFDVEAGASDPNQLKVHVLNEKTNEWELIGGAYSDGKVSAVTTHFSTFSVFDVSNEEEQDSVVTTPDNQSKGDTKSDEISSENQDEISNKSMDKKVVEAKKETEETLLPNLKNESLNKGSDRTKEKNANPKIEELPKTGEVYPIWSTIAGILALLCALGLIVFRKRRKEMH
ncbi:LPXTG cell wall anchor domain-containing protein [Alkalihalobacillus sp. FSL W8-0930]